MPQPQPQPQLSRGTSLMVLYLCHFLERFSYYGSRAILVLYLIAEDGLNITKADALVLYNSYKHWMYLLPLLLGLVTDFLLKKQRYAVALGGSFALLGYLAFLGDSMSSVYMGLIGIAVGTSWAKSGLTILVGRLFTKDDSTRNAAFFGFYTMMNLGALATSVLTASVANEYGWMAGFGLVAASTLVYLAVFLSVKARFPIIESNYKEGADGEDAGTSSLIPSNAWAFILGLSVLLALYWFFMEIGIIKIASLVSDPKLAQDYGIMLIPLLIAAWAYAAAAPQKFPGKIVLYALGFIVGGMGLWWAGASEIGAGLSTILGVNFIFSVSEVMLSPLALSWITRLSDVRYSSTMYGFYILAFSLNGTIVAHTERGEQELYISAIVMMAAGLLMLLFRRPLKNLIRLD
jgi:POT family proton-dependent oligopeptide transporter